MQELELSEYTRYVVQVGAEYDEESARQLSQFIASALAVQARQQQQQRQQPQLRQQQPQQQRRLLFQPHPLDEEQTWQDQTTNKVQPDRQLQHSTNESNSADSGSAHPTRDAAQLQTQTQGRNRQGQTSDDEQAAAVDGSVPAGKARRWGRRLFEPERLPAT